MDDLLDGFCRVVNEHLSLTFFYQKIGEVYIKIDHIGKAGSNTAALKTCDIIECILRN